MKVRTLPSRSRLVGADVLGDATGLAAGHVGLADVVEELGLAVVDVTHDGDDGRPMRGVVVLVVVVVGEDLADAETLLELDLLLLAGVDQADLRAEVGGEQLDHVVGERLGGGDHLALLHEEADDVGRRAVELGPDVLGRRGTLDDDLALGDGRVGRREARGLDGLELVAVAATTATTALGWAASATGTGTAATGTTGTTAGTGAAAGGRRGVADRDRPRRRRDGRDARRGHWARATGHDRRHRAAAGWACRHGRSWGRAAAGWACRTRTWAA